MKNKINVNLKNNYMTHSHHMKFALINKLNSYWN